MICNNFYLPCIIMIMAHILLLLYLLSGLSGLSSMVYLMVKYGNKTPYMKEYMKVHLAYTILILSALIIIYLKVNVVHTDLIMIVFVSSVLLWQGVLCWIMPRFSMVVEGTVFTRRQRLFWTIVPVCFPVLAVIQFAFRNSGVGLVPLIIGVSLFFSMVIWYTIKSILSKKESKKTQKIWVYFILFTIVIIAVEMSLKFYYGFLSDYPLNIPLIFLFWNVLSMYQFKQFRIDTENNGLEMEISAETAEKWKLTEREREIILAISEGYSNKEIATNLHLSFSTVKNHVYNIYKKTGARSRVDILNLMK